MKRKIKRTKSEEVAPGSPHTAYDAFSQQLRDTKSPMKLMREKFKELFNCALPEGIATNLIKAKISYHLLVVEGYQKLNLPVPEKVMLNYKASQGLNIDGFNNTMSEMLRLKSTKEEGTMGKKVKLVKKASKKEKAPRITVGGIFAEMFAANGSKKLTDDQLADAVNARIKDVSRGHEYCGKDVPTVRRKYNLGLLAGQSGKPGSQSEKYEPKKVVVKKK